MAFCATCGAPVEGRFCAKCGSSVISGGAPAGAVPTGPGPQPMAVSAPMADNVAGALCYALGFITGIIFLVLAPYNQNKTVRFHAFQSIFYSVAAFIVSMVIGIVWGMLFVAAGGLSSGLLGFGILSLVRLAFFCIWLWLLIATYQGKTVVLPVIGNLARQQA